MMNNQPREQLKYIIVKYGRSLSEDPQRCEALLRDLCGQYRKEINVIVSAAKDGVPVDLNNSQHRVPSDLLLAQLTKRLEDRLAIDREAARWGVESWALALGLISEGSSTTPVNTLETSWEQKNVVITPPITATESQYPTNNTEAVNIVQIDEENKKIESATARLKEANKNIRNAWIAGCFTGALNLAVTLSLDVPAMWIDVLLTFGLSFGIYKKNRICASILLTYFVISKLIFIELLKDNLIGVMVALVLIYIFYQGFLSTLEYHRQLKTNVKN